MHMGPIKKVGLAQVVFWEKHKAKHSFGDLWGARPLLSSVSSRGEVEARGATDFTSSFRGTALTI